MRILKRDGTYQAVDFGKIKKRIKYLVDGVSPDKREIGPALDIDPDEIAKEVCNQIVDGISSTQLDEFAAQWTAYRVGDHPDYGVLASRIIISNHHKNNHKYSSFSDMMEQLYKNTDAHGNPYPLISEQFIKLVRRYKSIIDPLVEYRHINDYKNYDYFGFKTLEKSYLITVKDNNKEHIRELPQHMLMRVALHLYGQQLDNAPSPQDPDVKDVIECYMGLSDQYYTHATPTLFNSGTNHPQLSSCFLLGVEDSIGGMYGCLNDTAFISKWAGGIGIWLHDIRSSGSVIKGTNGISDGVVPLIKVINDLAVHVNQGGGKRKGAISVYLEPWHSDIFEFLDLRKNVGAEELRARDIFPALFIPDLFMKKVKEAIEICNTTGEKLSGIDWCLMSPSESPGLSDAVGNDFERLYHEYEKNGKYRRKVDVLTIWNAILSSQKETSLPYMIYKDHVNLKSNQKNLGTIHSSNLCCEIMEYSDHEEYANCNLASINLKKMVVDGRFDMDLLGKTTKQVTRNLNRIIDINCYPVYKTKISNFRHRPIGIGVQGLADAFVLLGMPYESEEAQKLNREIFETIYYHALEASVELAEKRGLIIGNIDSKDLQELTRICSTIDSCTEFLREQDAKNKTRFTSGEIAIKELLENRNADAKTCLKYYLEKYPELGQHISLDLVQSVMEYQYLYKRAMDSPGCSFMGAYSSFENSPASKGILQFDMWNVEPSNRYDWNALKNKIVKYGLRNSLLVAPMPTASTAQIIGSNECFEPFTSNIYTRGVLSGSFLLINKYLQNDLLKRGLWNKRMKELILLNRGSIQDIDSIPDEIKPLYKTVWEMSKKTLINMAADRGAFVDQSQSFNIFVEDPDDSILTTIHLYAWSKGLKTGMYYLRRRTIVDPIQFSIDVKEKKNSDEVAVCKWTGNAEPGCLSCQ